MWIVYWILLGYSGLISLYGMAYVPNAESRGAGGNPSPFQLWVTGIVMFLVLAVLGAGIRLSG